MIEETETLSDVNCQHVVQSSELCCICTSLVALYSFIIYLYFTGSEETRTVFRPTFIISDSTLKLLLRPLPLHLQLT